MTIPLHALIVQWRKNAPPEVIRKRPEEEPPLDPRYVAANARSRTLWQCADELEAALASAVPRYDIAIDQEYGEAYLDVQPHPDGAWVRYGDL